MVNPAYAKAIWLAALSPIAFAAFGLPASSQTPPISSTPLTGTRTINLLPPGMTLNPPGQNVETPPPTPAGGLSCPDAQARYQQAVAALNQLRQNHVVSAEERNWNESRRLLEQYITETLHDCSLPRVQLAPPVPEVVYNASPKPQVQAEQRDASGKITVAAATIHTVTCANRVAILVYEYVEPHEFKAILPPNWGAPLGGATVGSFADAAATGCANVVR
jgi:hypothetical protein